MGTLYIQQNLTKQLIIYIILLIHKVLLRQRLNSNSGTHIDTNLVLFPGNIMEIVYGYLLLECFLQAWDLMEDSHLSTNQT